MAKSNVNTEKQAEVTRKPRKVERILLIYPFAVTESYTLETVLAGGTFAEAPLGLGYISSYVQANIPDVEVRLFDANAFAVKRIIEQNFVDMEKLFRQVSERISSFRPDIVGVSCLFHNIAPSAHRFVAAAKETDSSIVTVMGGNYPAGSPDVALADELLDFIIFSEGEKSFAALIDCLRKGIEPNTVVDGLSYRDVAMGRIAPALNIGREIQPLPHGKILYTPKLEFDKSLEEYPWPDRSEMDIEYYAKSSQHFAFRTHDRDKVRLATLTASRGCPFKCTFCSSKDFWGLQIRYRDPRHVVDEMEFLKNEYGINMFIFNDDNIMSNKKRVLALCNEIKRKNLNVNWLSGGGIQVSSMKPDVIQALVETGLNQFNLAIETGNPKTLKRINKPLTAGVAENVIAEIRKYDNVWITSGFITGFYFETLEDIEETLEYAGSLDLDWSAFYAFQALPGTEDFSACVKRGYIKEWDIWADGNVGDLVVLSTENFTGEQVRHLNYVANLKYNFINNRNLSLNPTQAIKDFNYVIEQVPDHAIGFFARSKAELKIGKFDDSYKSLERAVEIVEKSGELEKSSFKSNIGMTDVELIWGDYFQKLGIDLNQELIERKSTQNCS